MTQTQLREMCAQYYSLRRLAELRLAELADAELSEAVGEDWFSCAICGDIGPQSQARYMGEDVEDCCSVCWIKPVGWHQAPGSGGR